MMVAGSDVKLVTASSPSYLALALDKLHITYQEWNGAPGGNSRESRVEGTSNVMYVVGGGARTITRIEQVIGNVFTSAKTTT